MVKSKIIQKVKSVAMKKIYNRNNEELIKNKKLASLKNLVFSWGIKSPYTFNKLKGNISESFNK